MDNRKVIYLDDALEAIRKLPNAGIHWFVSAEAVFNALLKLPSAQSEQKKGRWVKRDTGHSIYYDCSLCGCVAPCAEVSDSFIWKLSAYCPDCGADMRGEGKNEGN